MKMIKRFILPLMITVIILVGISASAADPTTTYDEPFGLKAAKDYLSKEKADLHPKILLTENLEELSPNNWRISVWSARAKGISQLLYPIVLIAGMAFYAWFGKKHWEMDYPVKRRKREGPDPEESTTMEKAFNFGCFLDLATYTINRFTVVIIPRVVIFYSIFKFANSLPEALPLIFSPGMEAVNETIKYIL